MPIETFDQHVENHFYAEFQENHPKALFLKEIGGSFKHNRKKASCVCIFCSNFDAYIYSIKYYEKGKMKHKYVSIL